MSLTRSSGILLHVSSLPSAFGIGDLGKNAYDWIDFLDQTGTHFWQILPLNPTGYGNSPYQGLSAFAGNPLFIDPENLVALSLLSKEDLIQTPDFPEKKVDFHQVIAWKTEIFHKAFEVYSTGKNSEIVQDFQAYVEKNREWLNDYAIFMALREKYRLVSWSRWPGPLRMRETAAMNTFIADNERGIAYHKFLQYLFMRQWLRLKKYAHTKGIRIIGDIPIFMGFDCADVWSNPHLFELDENREPLAVAGVPPDFFSETGQLWGNPLYDWDVHQQEKYDWWIARVKETLRTVDLIRLDHFRGFAGYYRIPAGSKTAETGEWVPGPGAQLFDAMRSVLGPLPFIAEDLGVITPDVVNLRKRYNLPGMRLLQFAFWENADHEFLPHTYPTNCVAYTGTHDNDTSISWYKHAPQHEQKFCASYLGNHTENIAREMILAVWRSNADTAIAPMQDFLELDGWARMNLPATTEGNWLWRMQLDQDTESLRKWIKEINITFNRAPPKKQWPAKQFFKQ